MDATSSVVPQISLRLAALGDSFVELGWRTLTKSIVIANAHRGQGHTFVNDADAKDNAIMLHEWEQRYQSYRDYRAQYLTVLSISATAYLLGITLALSLDLTVGLKAIVLSLMVMGLIVLAIAHVIAGIAIGWLGVRLSLLEDALGMRPFDTVGTLRVSLRVSQSAVIITIAATIGLII